MKHKLHIQLFLLLVSYNALADNFIDWRTGKPGVQVVTNAPSRAEHTSLSNALTSVTTNYGPRVTALESKTNDWNVAFSWGDHAGLYEVKLPTVENGETLFLNGARQFVAVKHTDLANLNADTSNQHVTTSEKIAYSAVTNLVGLNVYAVPVGGSKYQLWLKE